ncbi:neutral zinc metallopeptidase [Sphaerimonospora cavernae]|uniref:Neutral zinc metallopeptidase n=1 Tax=Sphaerimonospora cavernae TaxID=1740611 RepID=A0ABV6UBK4_9ACTN
MPPPPAPPQPGPPPGWTPNQAVPPYGPRSPYGYAPNWRPPKRKSSAAAVIGGLTGVLAFVFVAIVVASAVLKSAQRHDPVSPIALPTSTFDPTSKPSTSKPKSRPTGKDSTSDKPAVTLNRGLKNNTVYRAGSLAQPNCPAGNASIYNHAQFKTLILKTGKCMGQAWAPALKRVGIEWRPPGYMIAQRRGRGACGDYPSPGSNVPYYCPSNSTIYASTSAMAEEYGPLSSWNGVIISMMGHEYGHHVQHLTGISESWWRRYQESSSRSGQLALTRRHELQATCFGAMFMRAVSRSYPVTVARRDTLLWAYGHLGDPPGGPRDHGSTRSNARWFRQGYTRPKAYQCNTWVMGSSYVS